jgi:hypothetical protein
MNRELKMGIWISRGELLAPAPPEPIDPKTRRVFPPRPAGYESFPQNRK